MAKTVGNGIIGFGGFATFAAQQFAQVPGISLRVIASPNRDSAMKAALRFGLPDVKEIDALMPDVDHGRDSLRMSSEASRLALS